jgi:hypothetical protein
VVKWQLFCAGEPRGEEHASLDAAKQAAEREAGYRLRWRWNSGEAGRYVLGGDPAVMAHDRRFGTSTSLRSIHDQLSAAEGIRNEVGERAFLRRWWVKKI